jgi:hypothetical protein
MFPSRYFPGRRPSQTPGPPTFSLGLSAPTVTRTPFGRVRMPFRELPHRVTLIHTVEVFDDAGGRVFQEVPYRDNVPCWVQDLSVTETTEFARQDMVYTTRIVFFQDPAPMRNEDLIQFGARYFRVKTIQNSLAVNFVWEVMGEEILF